jgi:hypothetical protein
LAPLTQHRCLDRETIDLTVDRTIDHLAVGPEDDLAELVEWSTANRFEYFKANPANIRIQA